MEKLIEIENNRMKMMREEFKEQQRQMEQNFTRMMTTQMTMMTDMFTKVFTQIMTAAPNNSTPPPIPVPPKLTIPTPPENLREKRPASLVEFNYEGIDENGLTDLGAELFEDVTMQEINPPPPENPTHTPRRRVRILTASGREYLLSQQRKLQKALLADDRRRERAPTTEPQPNNE